MTTDYVHPVDERHEAVLRTILKLEPGPELPSEVVEEYWRFKKPADRVGYRLSDGDLIRIALGAVGKTPEAKPYSFRDACEHRPVKFGERVLVEWRNQKVEAVFQRIRGDRAVVLLDDGTAEERKIQLDKVWHID